MVIKSIEEIIEPGHTRGNLKIVEQQITNQYFDLPETLLKGLPKLMGQIAATGTKREQIAATRCVIAMMKANNPQPVQHQHLHQHESGKMTEALEGETVEQRRQILRSRNQRTHRVSRIG
tara:strand:+ start:839 stop:1198 length:360 start_codon:yes stop_codon:yes gene_type:complete